MGSESLIRQLSGIIAVPSTPFNDDDTIDCESLVRYVKRAMENGVCGFLTNAMAAEVYQLSAEERRIILKTVKDAAGSQVSVIAGVSAGTQAERLAAVDLAQNTGCDGILVYLPVDKEDIFRQSLREIADRVRGFMMLQDWDPHGPGIPIRLLVQLIKEIPVLKSIKIEVANAGQKFSELLNASEEDMHFAGGWAVGQMIESLDRGVHAYMPSVLHDIYHRIFELFHRRRRDEAVRLFHRILPVLSFSHQHLDFSIQFNKRLLQKQGIFKTTRTRKPVMLFDEIHERHARELIERAMNISKSVKIARSQDIKSLTPKG